MATSSRTYFAALPLLDRMLASELMARVNRHYDKLSSMRAYQRMRRNRALYYGYPSDASPFDVGVLSTAGEGGELSYVHVNRMRYLGQRILSQAVTDDFGWQPVAANNDTASQEEAILAGSVLEYEKRERKLPSIMRLAAEAAITDAEAWVSVRWDPNAGARFDQHPETGINVYEGQLKVKRHSWFRLVGDWNRHDHDHDWLIITDDFVNKYDLAARFPEHADKIVALSPDHRRVLDWQRTARGITWDEYDSDLIPVYTFYHRATPAVPEGRETVFVDGDVILTDGALPYGPKLPLERMSPADMLDNPHGHAPMTDISGLQVLVNMLMSSAATNHVNNGVSTIAMPEDANVQTSSLFGGANVITYAGQTPPSAINMARTDPQTIELARLMSDEMVIIAGMNEVSTGQIQRQLSGAAMALLDSKSLQFASLFIASYRSLLASVGTAIIDRYRRFAKAPRRLEVISGAQRSYMLDEFTGDRLAGIARVNVEVRSALMETTAGKLDFAEKLITAPPVLQRPLMQLYKTGSIDVVLQPQEAEHMLRARENDVLRRGENPPTLDTDPHAEHIAAHRAVVASPEARANPAVIEAVSAHIAQHVDALRMTDPGLLMALGQQPIMPMPPPGSVAPGMPPEATGIDLGGGAPPEEPEMPEQPKMPINPATGERAPLPAIAMEA